MLRVAICDDENNELLATKELIKEYISNRGIPAVIDTFSSGKELLFADFYDLYILDVIMPDLNGVDLGIELRKSGVSGVIIYLTTSPDFALDSYDARAYHYLLKPVERNRLFDVLDSAIGALKLQDEYAYVKTREGTMRLMFDDIYYAELRGRAVRYVCRDSIVDGMTGSVSFKKMIEPLLKDRRFYLCGASLAVNLNHISMVDKSGVLISSGQHIEVPRLTINPLYVAWSNYWLEGGKQS